jgi:hypothetical protein
MFRLLATIVVTVGTVVLAAADGAIASLDSSLAQGTPVDIWTSAQNEESSKFFFRAIRPPC